MVISPVRSTFGGRVSMQSTWRWWSWSSLASSTVTMRSSFGMNDDSTLSSVVLPVPVPPETTMLSRPSMHARRKRTLRSSSVPKRDQVGRHEGVRGELPDREERAVDGERRDDRVHTGAVGQAGVDHRRRLVDAAADVGDDLVDDAADVGGVDEPGRDLLDLAVALDEDDVGAVDHDLGDAVVLEQLLDRAVADDVVADVRGELLVQPAVERDALRPRRPRRSSRAGAPRARRRGRCRRTAAARGRGRPGGAPRRAPRAARLGRGAGGGGGGVGRSGSSIVLEASREGLRAGCATARPVPASRPGARAPAGRRGSARGAGSWHRGRRRRVGVGGSGRASVLVDGILLGRLGARARPG